MTSGLCGNKFNPTQLSVPPYDPRLGGPGPRRPWDPTITLEDPTQPPCRKVPLGLSPSSCCFMAKSPRLRIVILCTQPCAPLPGYEAPVYGPAINAPPLTPITAGTPTGLSFAGRPAAYPAFGALPKEITHRFGKPAWTASSLVYDFGVMGKVGACGFMTGEGIVLAMGQDGAAQATMSFSYAWSRFPQCKTVKEATFCIKGCTNKGLAFTVLDSASYLSADPCQESIVVLNCQQFCTTVASTPQTVATCCVPACAPEDECDNGATPDPGYMPLPTCTTGPMASVNVFTMQAAQKGV